MGMSTRLDGGFYVKHEDNGPYGIRTKLVSFAYYFHRQPRPFSGGELLLYDADAVTFARIEPQHNSIVFFPAGCVHEIATVSRGRSQTSGARRACPSQEDHQKDFGNARFAMHGGVLQFGPPN